MSRGESQFIILNPRRACAARVTVLGLSVCPCSNSLLYGLFVPQTIRRNWRAGASQPSRSFERNFLFIGERERANLERNFHIYIIIGERERAVRNFLFIYICTFVRRVSAHARLLTRFFLSEIISKYFHIFTHAPENSPPIRRLQPSVTDRRCTASKYSWFEGAAWK